VRLPTPREGERSSKGRCTMNDLTIYDTLAESWWQAGSPLHLLAQMNPPRFAYFDPLVRHWPELRVLDVGCGRVIQFSGMGLHNGPKGGKEFGPTRGLACPARSA